MKKPKKAVEVKPAPSRELRTIVNLMDRFVGDHESVLSRALVTRLDRASSVIEDTLNDFEDAGL